MKPLQPSQAPSRGFSLVELMIAMTIGLILLLAVSVVFVSSSKTRSELDKSSRQIENGRFATEAIKEDVQLAAYYGNYVPPSSTTWTTPDPCLTALADLQAGFTASSGIKLPVGIYGYDSSSTPSCIQNRKANTDILVIRRLSTSEVNLASGASTSTGDFYMQVSACSDTPTESSFIFDTTQASFTLHKVKPVGSPASCLNGDKAPVNKYLVHIYYISTCNDCRNGGDGVPTLKMLELPGSSGSVTNSDGTCPTGESTPCPIGIAEGIEYMKFEYGVDSSGDGTPDSYASSSAGPDWKNVVAVKAFLLARNTETTSDYTDTKTYSLSSDGSLLNSGQAFSDHYRRHVYAITARAYNLADRR